jgi:carbonic anhydrase/acetyltransferase-like protein (isoleucine patch superfamily)
MKTHVLLLLCLLLTGSISAQKTVYIPAEFSTAPLNTWSYSKSYQSANFIVFWGNVVGTNPANYPDANLRFNPQAICDTLEKIYTKFVTELGFCSDAPAKNLGKYKLIIVMNDTWGANGPSGWAFGGTYGNTIGAMWVHPNSTRDGAVLSHELTHSLQGMISIQENTVGGGYVNWEPAGFFWEAHANYMRTQMYPRFAGDDLPRWMGTQMFHLSSTRHHYGTFKWLYTIQDAEGINMVNRLWKESVANEHPLITYRRLKGWTQSQLNDFLYGYAKKEVTYDYTSNNFGNIMRGARQALKTAEPHYVWRLYTILTQISAATGRYVVPDAFAPQDYGYNIIPLHPTCSSRNVTVKFKGHTEVNNTAGWRYGFVAVKADGTVSRYGTLNSAAESQISFQMNSNETELFLVVMGAPSTHTSYVWEPGWPKIRRYPYEIRVANAVPEGYQANFRAAYKTNGHTHPNGGGWVANSATVASTAYVGPNAIVRGNANISGNVRIEGTAWVENATVQNSVVIGGNANVWNGTYSGTASISENAILNNCTVSGNAIIKGNAMEWGSTFGSGVTVGGDAEIGSCSTAGVYLQVPHTNNGRTVCDGRPATHTSNVDVNATYTRFTDAQMAFTGTVTCSAVTTLAATHLPAGIKEVLVYPNPTHTTISLSMRNFRPDEDVVISLYNSEGMLMLQRRMKASPNMPLGAATEKLPPGVYVLKVTGSAIFTRKIVITR